MTKQTQPPSLISWNGGSVENPTQEQWDVIERYLRTERFKR